MTRRLDDALRASPLGLRPDLVGWAACAEGRPRSEVLDRVRHLRNRS